MRGALALLLVLGGAASVLRLCGASSITDFKECPCPALDTSHTCTCTRPRGYIATAPVISDDVLRYNIDVGHLSSVVIHFSQSDLRFASNSSCSVTIGDHHFGSSAETEQNQYVLNVDSNTVIYVVRSDQRCQYQLKYSTYDFEKNVTTIREPSGALNAPEDPSGIYQYRPNSQYLWILDPDEPTSQINISIEFVDLGAPYEFIHDEDMSNYTEGDFLFIGAGDDILSGNELLLYGRQEGLQVVIPSDVGHVFFYSTTSVFNATGFNLTYTSIPMVTTQTPTTTVSPIPTNLPQTYVAINGIPVQEWRDHNDTFRRAIASMSTDYLHKMHYNYPQNVTANLVYIHDIKTCHPVHCQRGNCVAYNFSVGVYIEGSVVFTREVLGQMLSDQSLQHHIPQNMKDCQICDEHPTVTRWVYIVVPVGVIASALVFTLIFWKCSKMESSAMAHEQYEKEQWERREDQRRRSSGDVSILGLGTSLASQGSLSSRRFTMPFPKVGKEAQDDDGESLDMSGFREYDPDMGLVDPSQFGLGKEFVKDKEAIHYFTNDAFVTDEEEVIYQRDGASCSFTDTDSNDSDDGGALSFHSSERYNKQPTRQIIVPADVHSTADAEETAL